MGRINLISEGRRIARRQRVKRRSWIIAVVSYSVLITVVGVLYRGVDTQAYSGRAAEEIAVLDAELAEIEQQRAGLRPELVEKRLVLTAGQSITDHPDWSLLLIYLADEVLGDNIILGDFRLAPMGGDSQGKDIKDVPMTVTLTGHATTTPAVSQFVLRLEGSGLFNRVSLERTRREPFLTGQAIAFEIHCLMSSAAGGNP